MNLKKSLSNLKQEEEPPSWRQEGRRGPEGARKGPQKYGSFFNGKRVGLNGQTEPLTENNGQKKSDILLYIYNVIEDEWSFINALTDPEKKKKEIDSSEKTSDCFFLSMATETNFVYVSPKPISKDFQEYSKKLLHYKQAAVIVPRLKSHLICEDLIEDKKKFKELVSLVKDYKRVILLSYVASPQLYKLKDKLVSLGIDVYTPEAPEIDYSWTVNFFGSKSGIRQLAQQSAAAEPDFIMPDGIICVGKFDAAKIAANKYLKEKGVVIKTNKGCGGNGVLIFRENELPANYKECEKKIYDHLSKEGYWEKFPIIIEDLVNVNYAVGGGFPNVEFRIGKNGNIKMVFYCVMMVTKKGEYYGLDISDEILSDRVTARMIDTGFYIAEKYSSAGYRGHFDIDMIAAKNNHLYVCESNTRNTGGTDIFRIASKLIGKEFMADCYIISRSHYQLKSKAFSFLEVMECLKPIIYSHRTKEGVIVNSENILTKAELIYTIIGKTRKRAYSLEEKMKTLLS